MKMYKVTLSALLLSLFAGTADAQVLQAAEKIAAMSKTITKNWSVSKKALSQSFYFSGKSSEKILQESFRSHVNFFTSKAVTDQLNVRHALTGEGVNQVTAFVPEHKIADYFVPVKNEKGLTLVSKGKGMGMHGKFLGESGEVFVPVVFFSTPDLDLAMAKLLRLKAQTAHFAQNGVTPVFPEIRAFSSSDNGPVAILKPAPKGIPVKDILNVNLAVGNPSTGSGPSFLSGGDFMTALRNKPLTVEEAASLAEMLLAVNELGLLPQAEILRTPDGAPAVSFRGLRESAPEAKFINEISVFLENLAELGLIKF